MNGKALIGLIAMVLLAATPARARDPKVYNPTAPWEVNFGDQRCIAARSYGVGGTVLDLTLQPSPVGDLMQLTLYSRGIGPSHQEALIRLGIDDRPPLDVKMGAFRTSKPGLRALRINLTREQFAPMRTAESIMFSAGGHKDRLTLRRMPDIMSKLDECLKGLQAYWNIGAEDKLKTRAESLKPLYTYFSSDDFPVAALFRSEQGMTGFVLMIDEQGKLAECSASLTSQHAALDEQACMVLRDKAVFKPAMGVDGKPARDVIVERIKWRL